MDGHILTINYDQGFECVALENESVNANAININNKYLRKWYCSVSSQRNRGSQYRSNGPVMESKKDVRLHPTIITWCSRRRLQHQSAKEADDRRPVNECIALSFHSLLRSDPNKCWHSGLKGLAIVDIEWGIDRPDQWSVLKFKSIRQQTSSSGEGCDIASPIPQTLL